MSSKDSNKLELSEEKQDKELDHYRREELELEAMDRRAEIQAYLESKGRG